MRHCKADSYDLELDWHWFIVNCSLIQMQHNSVECIFISLSNIGNAICFDIQYGYECMVSRWRWIYGINRNIAVRLSSVESHLSSLSKRCWFVFNSKFQWKRIWFHVVCYLKLTLCFLYKFISKFTIVCYCLLTFHFNKLAQFWADGQDKFTPASSKWRDTNLIDRPIKLKLLWLTLLQPPTCSLPSIFIRIETNVLQ